MAMLIDQLKIPNLMLYQLLRSALDAKILIGKLFSLSMLSSPFSAVIPCLQAICWKN